MTQNRTRLAEWQTLTEHFDALCQLAKEERRPALEKMGLESRLEKKLQLMLDSLDHTLSIIDGAVVDKIEFQEVEFAKKLEQQEFEGYTLDQLLHQGQMSAVFLASQKEPVERKVVIKLVRSEAPPEYHHFFRYEQLALAKQSHPNIATIYTVGKTDDDIAYIVMEFIDGSPLLDYCDTAHLSIHQRLEIFLKICDAISYSHRRGILHRDIKSSNILVRGFDGEPSPTIIDFGIASDLKKDADDGNEYLMGTPGYMSPEHVLHQNDMDARADIYSLGMVFFSLLVGRIPFDRFGLEQAGQAERLSLIVEFELPEPSSYFQELSGSEQEALSHQRATSPTLMARDLDQDLNAIYLKATHKDREQRYESVRHLALDVQQHLDGYVVSSHRASLLYRARKFARRNKTAVILLLVLMVSGIAASGLLFTKNQTIATESLKAQSEKQNADAIASVLLDSIDLSSPQSQKRTGDDSPNVMLDHNLKTLNEIQGLAPEVRFELLLALAEAFRSNSEAEKAQRIISSALDDLNTADPIMLCKAHLAAAAAYYDTAIYKELQHHSNLANQYCSEAPNEPKHAIESQKLMARASVANNDIAGATNILTNALELYQEHYNSDSPLLADLYRLLAEVNSWSLNFDASIDAYQRAREILVGYFEVSHARIVAIDMTLFQMYCITGNSSCAPALGYDLRSRIEQTYGKTSLHYAFHLNELGSMHIINQQYDEAIEILSVNASSMEAQNATHGRYYVNTQYFLAQALMKNEDFTQALALTTTTLNMVTAPNTKQRVFSADEIALQKVAHAEALFATGDTEAASQLLAQITSQSEQIEKNNSSIFMKVYSLQAIIAARSNRSEAAIEASKKALSLALESSERYDLRLDLAKSTHLYTQLKSVWDPALFSDLVESWEKLQKNPSALYIRRLYTDIDEFIAASRVRP